MAGQHNAIKSDTIVTPPSGMKGWKFLADGTFVVVNEDGSTTPITSTQNILANKGVKAESFRPTSGLTTGDVYVTTDTFKIYTATGTTTWNSGVDLRAGQFVTDTSINRYLIYQFTGNSLWSDIFQLTLTTTGVLIPNGNFREAEYEITALSEALTIANPSGDTYNWNSIVIAIEDDGTARALSFGTQYAGDLPTTTEVGKVLHLGFRRRESSSQWLLTGNVSV